ncbi:hypothetical protein FS749_005965 [Ceratobasidium sp. UAMH 11750]|nr:hypothetical protein FS749_005965 [Ceratobasidium sp. UAMH 11750]
MSNRLRAFSLAQSIKGRGEHTSSAIMSRVAPAHKRHARPTTSELAHQARAHRTRKAPLQLATPPTTPEPSRDGSVRLSMPRELPRPMLRPISSAALAAIDPELAAIPVEFVRRSVVGMSKR